MEVVITMNDDSTVVTQNGRVLADHVGCSYELLLYSLRTLRLFYGIKEVRIIDKRSPNKAILDDKLGKVIA